jgi:hypothetical protein
MVALVTASFSTGMDSRLARLAERKGLAATQRGVHHGDEEKDRWSDFAKACLGALLGQSVNGCQEGR